MLAQETRKKFISRKCSASNSHKLSPNKNHENIKFYYIFVISVASRYYVYVLLLDCVSTFIVPTLKQFLSACKQYKQLVQAYVEGGRNNVENMKRWEAAEVRPQAKTSWLALHWRTPGLTCNFCTSKFFQFPFFP